MDAQKNSTQPRPRTLCKSFTIYGLPVVVVFAAVWFSLIKSDFYTTQYLRLNFSPRNTNLFGTLFGYPDYDGVRDTQKSVSSPKPHFCVLWMAPFLSGGGYSSEAWSYITAIQDNIKNPLFRLAIEQHGDLVSIAFWEGLPEYMRKMAFELHGTQCSMNETVVICHSEPGAWYPPLFDTLPCPPSGNYGDFLAVIGRTMFETDRVNHEHVERCNSMDYVWVPTEFHVSTFVKSGVKASKVVKVVQSVDVEFFDPFKYQSLDLVPLRELVLGKKSRAGGSEKEFVFLSIFKWEYRKGWDVLLRAYLEEFSGADGVALYLLTNPFHTDNDFSNKIVEFVEDSGIERPDSGWARVYVIDKHIPQVDLPRLYRSANVFVLPSRGEGWGRPLVEAMSMSLPVIATNWSGPTEYLTEENGYPLTVDKMGEVKEGPFKGHLWAEPSVDKLRRLMRHVMTNADEARVKGVQARKDMISRFSPKNVAEIVSNLISTVLNERA
uniref:Uncharacterized protein n=1 Tax=Opuntia streptacantha TaxID=393608 RepID=A0A7C9F0R7_OPUST